MRQLLITACATLGLLALTGTDAVTAGGEAKSSKVLSTKLGDMPEKEANIVLFEVGPGWETERHIHPGHVFVYVLDGTIEIAVEGEELRRIPAGEAFHELPDKPMIGRNASAAEGARFVVFQVGPAGEALMVAKPK